MKKLNLYNFAVTMSALLALGFAGVGSARAEVIVPIATWGSPSHINIVEFIGALEEELQNRTDGEFQVRHYPAGQLAEDADMPIAIPTGKVRLGWVTISGWSGLIPDVKIVDAPTGLTMEQMAAATDGPDGIKQALDQHFQQKGATLLAITDLGPPVIVSRRPIASPDDLRGMRIRVYSEGTAELARELGAAPLQLPFSDVYMAMERGTIDAAFIGFQGVQSQRMHEVAKHLLIPASFLGTAIQGWVANLEWWQGLDTENRDTLADAIRAAELRTRNAIIEDRSQLADRYRAEGMTVVDFQPGMEAYDAWAQATAPLMERAEQSLSSEIVAPINAQMAQASESE